MFSNPKHNVSQLSLDPGMVVVDFGAGSGFYALEAAHAVGSGGKVYAIDIQKDLLAKLKTEAGREHLHNIEVICGDAEKKGGAHLKEGIADAAIASNVLFQITDKRAFIEEMYRVLAKGGKLLVIDWSDSFGGIGPQKEDVFPEMRAQEMLAQCGFIFLRKIEAGVHHYGMIFRK